MADKTIIVLDVSRWQGSIDWAALRAAFDRGEIGGVVIKATGADGGLYTDGMLQRNRDEARKHGVPHWFYHYKGAGISPEDQAAYLVNAIGGLQAGEALVLDDENEGKINVPFGLAFGRKIKEITGLNQVLYSNLSRFQNTAYKEIAAIDVGAWVAKYGLNDGSLAGAGAAPSLDGIAIIMWQYTSMNRVAGISANTVDTNVFYGDVAAFQKYGAPGAIPAPSTPPPTPQPVPVPTNDVYVVKASDFDGLAAAMRRIGISDWQGVANLNGLSSPYTIYVGQTLKLKSAVPVVPESGTYTVKGTDFDGLAAAMARIGISNWQAVADHNGLRSPYTIWAGQVLNLPGGTPSVNNTRAYYIVKSSDSDGLAAAMSRVGISNWKRVADINGLASPYVIHAGDKLWLN